MTTPILPNQKRWVRNSRGSASCIHKVTFKDGLITIEPVSGDANMIGVKMECQDNYINRSRLLHLINCEAGTQDAGYISEEAAMVNDGRE